MQGLQTSTTLFRGFRGETPYTEKEKWELRKEFSKPILKNLHKWLLYHQSRGSPKSCLGGAIQYTLNNWEALNTFLEDGRLEIDNNRAERAIKPVVIGRKNYLFMGGQKGGEDVLERLPTHPQKRISELLP